ncbi:MAG: HPF/RaiA family ribosome-associated protein [Bacteroidota bacterium]
MQKTIEPVNFNASQDLIQRIDEMFDGLDKYYDEIISADIYLKSLTETPKSEKLMEIKVFLPGKDLFIEEQGSDFVTVAQKVFDVAKRKLSELKDKAKDRREPRVDKF